MCGILIAFVVLAAIVASVLHVSAGWGLGIVAALVVGAALVQARNPNAARRVGKTGLLFTNICPNCRKHNKSGAKVCRYCRTALVVRPAPAVAAASGAASSGPAEVKDDRPSKVCPDCAETVLAAARKCRFCGHEFE